MKRLFTILTTLALLCAVGCEEQGDDNVNPNDKPNTEQPGEKPDDGSEIPDDAYISINKEVLTFSPDGESIDIKVYSNYEWTLTNNCDWVTTSISSGEASDAGVVVTLTADLTYDDREGTITFSCGKAKKLLVVSQGLKEVIIADENNVFNVPAEGGNVIINYQTTVECEVVIPEDAKSWISLAPATRALVSESATLTVAENTTYSERSAVVKVVKVGDNTLFAEYTINQVQNDAIIADKNNIFNVPAEGGVVEVAYQTNVECEVIIPEEAKSWISLAPATRALVSESATLTVAENTTYSERSAVVKVVKVGDNTLFAEYTINQVQNDAIIADKNNIFNVPAEGGVVEVAYQTNVECEVIIPEEAKSWISLAPATRALVNESATLTIAENTTYSARSAVIKVVKVDDNTLFAEYTINQVQNDAIIAENNTFELSGIKQSINIAYRTNVECEVVIPEEAQSWISLASATRALVDESATLNIADNNTGTERSAVVKVVVANNNELVAEYIITQNQRYFMEYTSKDGFTVRPYDSSAFSATIIRNKYIDGKGYIDFNAPITSIGERAFYNCSSLTSVTIPNSVTLIGYRAFRGCSSLTSITIPDSVTSIGEDAFEYCTSLKSVHITDIAAWCGISFGNSAANPLRYAHNLYLNGELATDLVLPNGVTSIGYRAFSGCTSLTSITIPDSVTSIGEHAFYECSSLKSITIPDSVTSIGDWAFAYCSSLTSVTIGNGVTSIGEGAFSDCSSLTSITIPDSVTSIGDFAFEDCSSLTSITIPDSVTSIGKEAFYGCYSLTSITIPDGVTSIGEWAFYGCSSLVEFKGKCASEDGRCLIVDGILNSFAPFGITEYTIPESVTSIGNYAFYDCDSLKSITIPDSVILIGDHAFEYCTSLAEVYCKPTIPPTGRWSMFDDNASGRKIYVPRASVNAYKRASYWSNYAGYIEGYDFE